MTFHSALDRALKANQGLDYNRELGHSVTQQQWASQQAKSLSLSLITLMPQKGTFVNVTRPRCLINLLSSLSQQHSPCFLRGSEKKGLISHSRAPCKRAHKHLLSISGGRDCFVPRLYYITIMQNWLLLYGNWLSKSGRGPGSREMPSVNILATTSPDEHEWEQ